MPATIEHKRELHRQYKEKVMADPVKREKYRQQCNEVHSRYIAKVMADPVKREKYLEKRKEYSRRHIAKIVADSVGVPTTTKYYLIAHLPFPNDSQTWIQKFDDEFALADYLHNEPGFEREDCITELGQEPERLSRHEYLIIKGEICQRLTCTYKPNLTLVKT